MASEIDLNYITGTKFNKTLFSIDQFKYHKLFKTSTVIIVVFACNDY